MTVGELKAALAAYRDDMPVVIYKAGKGMNCYVAPRLDTGFVFTPDRHGRYALPGSSLMQFGEPQRIIALHVAPS